MMAGKLLFFAVPPLSLAFRSSWLRKDAAKFSMNLGLPAAAGNWVYFNVSNNIDP